MAMFVMGHCRLDAGCWADPPLVERGTSASATPNVPVQWAAERTQLPPSAAQMVQPPPEPLGLLTARMARQSWDRMRSSVAPQMLL